MEKTKKVLMQKPRTSLPYASICVSCLQSRKRKKETFKRYRGIKRKVLQRATRSNVSVNMQMKMKKMDERHKIIARVIGSSSSSRGVQPFVQDSYWLFVPANSKVEKHQSWRAVSDLLHRNSQHYSGRHTQLVHSLNGRTLMGQTTPRIHSAILPRTHSACC